MGKNFDSPDALVRWLEAGGVDTAVWGADNSKSTHNLWDEYLQGEVSFEAHPLVRIVRVVQVLIKRNDVILLEVEQVFRNGKRRFRNQPPAEKIKGDESIIDAAYRCLKEELGLNRDQVDFLGVDQEMETIIRDSPSYPGLPTRYTIQRIRARVTGLPDEDFWRANSAVNDGDPVSRHLWAWREP